MQPHPYLKKAYQSESRLILYKIFAFKKKIAVNFIFKKYLFMVALGLHCCTSFFL